MNQTFDATSAIYSPLQSKDRNSSSTWLSEDLNEIEQRINSIDLDVENQKSSMMSHFHPEISQPEITSKLLKKAVHVLLSICWDRDIDQNCTWMALMIFYSYKAKRVIRKQQLQKIVSVCILLSSKLLRPEKLCMKDIIQITNGKYSTKQLSQTEGQILLTLNFDLYIENSMNRISGSYNLTEDELNEVFCLSEMLMTKNSEIFWKASIVGSLIKLVLQVHFENSSQMKKEILEIVKSKESEFILRKYSSKLDTQNILQKLNRN